jgi:hypothetical protein
MITEKLDPAYTHRRASKELAVLAEFDGSPAQKSRAPAPDSQTAALPPQSRATAVPERGSGDPEAPAGIQDRPRYACGSTSFIRCASLCRGDVERW